MNKGILVYDRKDSEYNKWFIEHIISTGSDMGLEISLCLTEDIVSENGDYDIDLSDVTFFIMRNRNKRMSEYFEGRGIRCFNSSYVCGIGNDKWEMYRDFCAAGIPVMYTQCSKLPYPFVMKPRDGHGGQNVFLIRNNAEYENALSCITEGLSNYIFQMVASQTGRDIRVYVCGDTIITAMDRTASPDGGEFRANFSLGGRAEEHALTDDELNLVAKVAKHIGADFVGIDLMYNNEKPVVSEIEDAVGTRMLYEMTDIDPVRIYLEWITKKLS